MNSVLIPAFGLLCLATPAWSHGLTLADLQGATISISAVHQERLIRNGQPMSVMVRTTGKIHVGPGKTITSQFQNTATNERNGRSRAGPAAAGSFTLDTPRQASQRYEVVWTFIDSSLVRLRVFSGQAGGQKMTIHFNRTGSGISCTFAAPMAREVGVGRIQKGSEIDHASIEILEFRQITSSCRVARQ
jgi:hypothetical protein